MIFHQTEKITQLTQFKHLASSWYHLIRPLLQSAIIYCKQNASLMLPSNNLWKRNKTDEWCYSDESLREKKRNSSDNLRRRQDKCLHSVLISNATKCFVALISPFVVSLLNERRRYLSETMSRQKTLHSTQRMTCTIIVASFANLQLQTSPLLMIIDRSESTKGTLHRNLIQTSINSWLRLISPKLVVFNRTIFHNERR